MRAAAEQHELAIFKRPGRAEWAEVAADLPSLKNNFARTRVEVTARDTWANHVVPAMLALVEADVELGDTHVCCVVSAGCAEVLVCVYRSWFDDKGNRLRMISEVEVS